MLAVTEIIKEIMTAMGQMFCSHEHTTIIGGWAPSDWVRYRVRRCDGCGHISIEEDVATW